jgi:hypothetical protein
VSRVNRYPFAVPGTASFGFLAQARILALTSWPVVGIAIKHPGILGVKNLMTMARRGRSTYANACRKLVGHLAFLLSPVKNL